MTGECERERDLLEYVRKASPPPFLLKTYMLVEDPATDDVVSWNAAGTAFVVWQPAEFSRDLLPTLFKHSNFSSFVRQLNTYGFRKIATGRWEFSNDMFCKGKKDQLCEIRRRKALSNKPQHNVQPQEAAATTPKDHHHSDNEDQKSSSATSSSSEVTTLIDENKRLKQENGVLNSELSLMKKKCKELLDLVTIYGSEKEEQNYDDQSVEVQESNSVNCEGPKLFGVRLMEVECEREKKRKRSENPTIVLSQTCK